MAVPTVMPAPRGPGPLLRRELGAALRRGRHRQGRTLRDVASDAGISVGYLSELERGRKEASSELLSEICRALGVGLAELLVDVAGEIADLETRMRTPAFPAAGTTRCAA